MFLYSCPQLLSSRLPENPSQMHFLHHGMHTWELVLGSSPTGRVRLEKGALHVASFIPVGIGGLLPEVSLKASPLATGCCTWRAVCAPLRTAVPSPQATGPLQRIFLYTRLADTVSLIEISSITAVSSLHGLSAPFCPAQNWPCF